jgi:hypothetical protein
MNFELIRGPLEVNENPGLETTDPRFSDIATLVQEGNYGEAAAGAEAILTEKIYDIRIIGYFFYGHFVERGIPALADIYLGLVDILNDNLEAVGPVKNRAKHLQTILNWLIKQVTKQLLYEEEKKSGLFEEWTTSVTTDQVEEVLDASDKLRRSLGPILEDTAGPVFDGLTKINDWLKAFQRLIYRAPEPESAEEEQVEEEAPEGAIFDQEPRQQGKRRFMAPGLEIGEDASNIEGSYHLNLLMRKLDAFDYLISEAKYANAAVVADDINAIIASFDPRIYFPKLFTRFALLSAAHVNELTSYAEYKESPAWTSLQELYKIDMDSFIEFNPEAVDTGHSGGGGQYGSSDDYEKGYEDEDR